MAGVIVNQWSAVFTQNPQFGFSAPACTSVIVSLNASTSVGGGTGIPSAGNWLFTVTGWHQGGSAAATLASVGDDTHQWWRPATPSNPAGTTRTTIWYQPNILPPSVVYVAPDGYSAGMAVLVVEVSGLGAWDQVGGYATSYANSATSLTLAAPAAPPSSFFLAAMTAGLGSGTQTLLASGWNELQQVTVTNGTDNTGDVIVTAAYATESTAQSITGTDSVTAPLSGAIISVLINAPSPVPGSDLLDQGGGPILDQTGTTAIVNPNWPYLVFEAAFGAGYGTPPDQMVWTNLQAPGNGYRLRKWEDSSGVQYELGALEASETTMVLDNPDGNLSPFNTGSPWYPDVVPGTPVRIRAIPPATTGVSRWYVLQRNMERWPQGWDDAFRGLSNATATDCWSVINKLLPTCYRGEVLADSPYAWWPCDDSGINRAAYLINAAPGNSNPLAITVAANGLNASVSGYPWVGPVIYSAVQAFAQDTGWMYGDPLSAAWQQSGNGLDNHGRYLYCQDANFPQLSEGVTIEGWWSFPLVNPSGDANPGLRAQYGEPGSKLLLWSMFNSATSERVADVELSVSQNFITVVTYENGVGTSTVLSFGVGLTDTAWTGVTVTLNTAGWTAWVNAGSVAETSVAATFTPATWDMLYVGGEYDAGGQDGIGNYSVSHVAVYPGNLPTARVQAHFNAAYTGFGVLPPVTLDVQFYSSDVYAPDGTNPGGSFFGAAGSGNPATVACVAATTIGTFYSAASYPTVVGIVLQSDLPPGYFWITLAGGSTSSGSFAFPRIAFYTAAGSGSECLQASTSRPYTYCNSYGTGSAYSLTATPLGDSVQWRIERLLGAGGAAFSRCIDPSAGLVVAALDIGGQACGDAINNIVASDGGLMYVDNVGNLCYWQQSHLAAQPVLWNLGPNIAAGQIPYLNDATWDTDPQRVYNDIEITQYDITQAAANAQSGLSTGSGEQAGGLVFAPGSGFYSQIQASQNQYGSCPYQITSYLQSTTAIQNQADWLFANYGAPVQRITSLTVQAAAMTRTCPQAWMFVLGANVGDVVTVTQHQPGQPAFTGTWRISHVDRVLSFGEAGDFSAALTITGDYYPITYWTSAVDDELGNPLTAEDGAPLTNEI